MCSHAPALSMGITFSAAGTSFPNVFASMVVARQGLGNCAVSNALGGNVFNIFMGLGLPWLFYTLVGSDDVDSGDHVYVHCGVGCLLMVPCARSCMCVFVCASPDSTACPQVALCSR